MEKKSFSGVHAVIFDKDGTLIDFDAFWISVSERALELLFSELGVCDGGAIKAEIMLELGVVDGVTDIDGVLCRGTYRQISRIVYDRLSLNGITVGLDALHERLLAAYSNASDAGVIKPTAPGVADALRELHSRGVRLAVVTTDNEEITKKCLCALGVIELFDKIYCDDGIIPTKPNPEAIKAFCECYGISREGIVMVGDTMTDVLFARAGGVPAIGVSLSELGRQRLLGAADVVLRDVSELPSVILEQL